MHQSNPGDARHWRPRLERGADATAYRRIVEALERAIAAGELRPGARLPPQRELAPALGLSVGTVAAAYVEAERRGLVHRHVGRGTFVATAAPPRRRRRRSGVIDLSTNFPPYQVADGPMRELLGQLIRDADVAELLGYPEPAGSRRHQECVAAWTLRHSGFRRVAAGEFVLCNGATQALSVVLAHLLSRGDPVLCEARTYGGYRFAAAQLGCTPVPVALDAEGVVPEALEAAAARSGARVVLLVPTLQNPTAAIASPQRRRAIVEVARRRVLWIVEDDVYGGLLEPGTHPVPLAELAPERVFHVSGISKSVAPGLRLGWVRPPADRLQALAASMAYQTAGANPFGCLAFARLCETRVADEICASIRAELGRRRALAAEVLGLDGGGAAPHLWLPLPPGQPERIHHRMAAMGVLLTEPGACEADGGPPAGLRACLGAAESLAELGEALHALRGELARAAGAATPAWGV